MGEWGWGGGWGRPKRHEIYAVAFGSHDLILPDPGVGGVLATI